MKIIKLLPKPKHPDNQTKQSSCVRETHWEDPLNFDDINRHCSQLKRCAKTANNRDLAQIDKSVNKLLKQFNDCQ